MPCPLQSSVPASPSENAPTKSNAGQPDRYAFNQKETTRSILKRFLQSVLKPSGSQTNTTRTSEEHKPLPTPKCSVCGKELPPGPSLAQEFGQAGWVIVTSASPGTGLDAALYTALVCEKCESISCYPCAGFRPGTHPDGPNYSVACPKCGGKVVPLNTDIYRALLVKAGHTPIKAVRQGDAEIAKELIAAGGDLSEKNAGGGIMLHDAAKSGNVEITRILLEQGAAINARDRIGMTPLYLAA